MFRVCLLCFFFSLLFRKGKRGQKLGVSRLAKELLCVYVCWFARVLSEFGLLICEAFVRFECNMDRRGIEKKKNK